MADRRLNPLNCVNEVANGIWPLVNRRIHHWWCFDGIVQGLRDEIAGLEREMRDKERKIVEARLRAETATTEFEDWFNEGTRKIEEAMRIVRGCDDLKVWNIIPRYLVGKSAQETAQGIAKLRNKGNLITIADPAPPASEVTISRAPILEFQSRRRIEEHIIKSLKDGNVRMIAICGGGGVGKTAMAQRIEDRVRKEKLFDEILHVVVTHNIDMLKIQNQIAEILRLGLREDSLPGRAHELRTRLMDSKKKLIIFDDVWKSFDPQEIGVPYEGCKIILTSRLKDVCQQQMEADEVIELEVLDREEAWTLFREKCGDCVDDSVLLPIAEKVAAECKGLPIALVTVGKALKNKNRKSWEDALFQLGSANPANFPQVLEYVYMPLKLSYYFLGTQSEKDLFLLCCWFPEDYDIRIEDLALISFGLGLFEGISSIEDGRNRTYSCLRTLRSRFLLLAGRNEAYVKMHGFVRDMGIFIGSKEQPQIMFLKNRAQVDVSREDSFRNCNWMLVDISINANAKLPSGQDFPNLRLLMVLSSGFDVNDIGFKGKEQLRVLYFSYPKNLQSLPSSLKFLERLRKLHLEGCEVKDMSVVGELSSLEILRVWSCREIEELPVDVGKLMFLRLLELKNCRKLRRIVSGVISRLVALEELKIVECSIKWEARGHVSEERNASIWELEFLHNLTVFEFDIHDLNLIYQEMSISPHLVRYQIRNAKSSLGRFYRRTNAMEYERKIELRLPRGIIVVGNWIWQLVKETQSLTLEGDGSNYFKLDEIKSLRELVLTNCSTVLKLFHYKFPMLEQLQLTQLEQLEVIIDGRIPGSNSFQYLESLHISDCPNLQYLFRNGTESNTEASVIEFPMLKKLRLYDLPELVALAQGAEIIKFPQLIDLMIFNCPMLRTRIEECPKLQMVDIYNLDCTLHLISSRDVIENLAVGGCDTIEEMFWDDGNRHITFPELMELQLRNLPYLTTFYRGAESIKFPKLRCMRIGKLARLNSLLAMDSEHTHHHQSLHYFCDQKVEIIDLKVLHFYDLPDEISELWCRHIPISFFGNLEELSISNVDGITNSISSSAAKALVNLKSLEIRYCKGTVDVIEDESTHVPVTCVFPNLHYLSISYNSKLRSFCQWKHDFELPSLEEVNIYSCPLMTIFTLGSVSTPKLNRFSINGHEVTEMKGLKRHIHHFTTEQQNVSKDE